MNKRVYVDEKLELAVNDVFGPTSEDKGKVFAEARKLIREGTSPESADDRENWVRKSFRDLGYTEVKGVLSKDRKEFKYIKGTYAPLTEKYGQSAI